MERLVSGKRESAFAKKWIEQEKVKQAHKPLKVEASLN